MVKFLINALLIKSHRSLSFPVWNHEKKWEIWYKGEGRLQSAIRNDRKNEVQYQPGKWSFRGPKRRVQGRESEPQLIFEDFVLFLTIIEASDCLRAHQIVHASKNAASQLPQDLFIYLFILRLKDPVKAQS